MLQITAGIATLVCLAQPIYVYDINLTIYLWGYFFIGLLGLLLESFFRQIKPWLKINQKWTAIKVGLANHDTWLASLILALIMALVYSAIWPSGRMEGWVNNGADFNSWIFLAQYKLGLIDPINSGLTPDFHLIEMDSVGTHILIAFISVAQAQLPCDASQAVVVTFIVWFGGAVYYLVRKVFKLSFFQTLFIASALCLGSLLNYIAMIGMFGHLLSLIIFIVALTQLINNDPFITSYKYYVKNLFFPLFTLFISYQAGYTLYSAVIILSLFLLALFSLNEPLLTKFYHSLLISLAPVFIVSCLCALLMPGIAYHISHRTVEIANQQAGWSLPLINPLLFSGLPFFLSPDQFAPHVNSLSIYTYLPLILLTLILTLCCWKILKHKFIEKNINFIFITVLIIIFLVSITIFIFLFNYFGNTYIIWKFCAYLILPLSFINLSLILILLQSNKKQIIKFVNISLIILVAFYLYKIFDYNYFIKLQTTYFHFQPNHFLRSSLKYLNDTFKNYTFVFNLSDPSLIFNTSMLLSKSNNILIFYPSTYYILSTPNHLDKIKHNSLFITNVYYEKILNASKFPVKLSFKPFDVYNYDSIKDKGYVQITSNHDPFIWKITNYPVTYKFIVPSRMIDKDIIFSLSLSPDQQFVPGCNRLEYGLRGDDNQINWVEKNLDDPGL
ncbi:MAG: hypothetical protein LBF58_03845, partial [Deltaproteobacteria bacterium]|nr:hypothetical protein [Deltaproteobacteria bacterium]